MVLPDIRQQKGISQDRLARLAEITVNAYARIERGEAEPRVGTARAIARVLGVSLDELIFPGEQRRQHSQDQEQEEV